MVAQTGAGQRGRRFAATMREGIAVWGPPDCVSPAGLWRTQPNDDQQTQCRSCQRRLRPVNFRSRRTRPVHVPVFRAAGVQQYVRLLIKARHRCDASHAPFALAEGAAHRRMLILPADVPADNDLMEIGRLTRREVEHWVVAYQFDWRTHALDTTLVRNPNAGCEHVFKAWRVRGDPKEPVTLR